MTEEWPNGVSSTSSLLVTSDAPYSHFFPARGQVHHTTNTLERQSQALIFSGRAKEAMMRAATFRARYRRSPSVKSLSTNSSSDSTLKSWERSAKLVKNTDKNNKYLEHIRQEHDPALQIKTLEDELRGTMGKALGRQGQKVLRNIQGMKQQLYKYQQLQQEDASVHEIRECAMVHNDFRKKAMHARWELLVQRQAVGFLVQNQSYVNNMYPIGDAIPLPAEDGSTEQVVVKEHKEIPASDAEFGTQLDWWQRVGRWR